MRALEDARSLARALMEEGLEPVTLPLIAIEPACSGRELRAKLLEPRPDWILVTSRRAAGLLKGAGPFDASIRVGSVGSGTSQALGDAGFQVDLEGDGSGAASLAASFGAAVGAGPLTVVWPTGDRSLDVLPKAISELGHELFRVEAYRTRLLCPEPADWNAAVPEAVAGCFTSPSTVSAFVEAAKAHGTTACLDHLLAASFGGSTESALMRAGFRNLVTAPQSTPAALAHAIAASI
jgi:uroporphyrinogen-III synthase